MNKVKGGYHQIANEGERYKVINGDKPPKEVFKSVWQIIVNSYGDMNDQ
jgi:thymidylate kinase